MRINGKENGNYYIILGLGSGGLRKKVTNGDELRLLSGLEDAYIPRTLQVGFLRGSLGCSLGIIIDEMPKFRTQRVCEGCGSEPHHTMTRPCQEDCREHSERNCASKWPPLYSSWQSVWASGACQRFGNSAAMKYRLQVGRQLCGSRMYQALPISAKSFTTST